MAKTTCLIDLPLVTESRCQWLLEGLEVWKKIQNEFIKLSLYLVVFSKVICIFQCMASESILSALQKLWAQNLVNNNYFYKMMIVAFCFSFASFQRSINHCYYNKIRWLPYCLSYIWICILCNLNYWEPLECL